METQFDAQLKSKDGKTMLFIRGPFQHGEDLSFEMRMVAVSEMGKWQQIWKGEEVEDE